MKYHLILAISLGLATCLERGLTTDFINWLNSSSYEPYGFNKSALFGGSFGGRASPNETLRHRPVVFVHGTGDAIIGNDWHNNGFRFSIEEFLHQGYSKAELYGSAWGWGDYYHEFQHVYQQEYIHYIRKFIEAVLEYTGAAQIDVIAHSMGVPLTRRALKGGWAMLPSKDTEFSEGGKDVKYYIGKPLTERVRHFIGIVGPNFGVHNCTDALFSATFRACNILNGFYPGSSPADPWPADMSSWLIELNNDPNREAQHTSAFASLADDVIPAYAYDRLTAEYPTADTLYLFDNYSHRGARDKTADLQYRILNDIASE